MLAQVVRQLGQAVKLLGRAVAPRLPKWSPLDRLDRLDCGPGFFAGMSI